METGDRYEPYRLVDADGTAVAPVAVFFRASAEQWLWGGGMDLPAWTATRPLLP